MTQAYNKKAFAAHRPLAETERTLVEQQAYVRRLIVCGGPTQGAEDRLKQLEQELLRLRTAHQCKHTGG
jgi:hypothetical protein